MLKNDNLNPEARLTRLGIIIPDRPQTPVGAFCNVRVHGDLAYVSGQGSVMEDGTFLRGKVGRDVDVEEAREYARLVMINMLAALKAQFGTLDVVRGAIKLLGLVNATPEFGHPYVRMGLHPLTRFSVRGRFMRGSSFGVGRCLTR